MIKIGTLVKSVVTSDMGMVLDRVSGGIMSRKDMYVVRFRDREPITMHTFEFEVFVKTEAHSRRVSPL